MNILNFIISQYQQGGPMMHAIALCLAVTIAIIFERIIRIVFQYNVDGTSSPFLEEDHRGNTAYLVL